MRTNAYLNFILRMTMVLTLIFVISSCQKSEKIQTFNDVFDTSGMEALNAQIATAKTLADLPAELRTSNLTVPEAFKSITPREIADWYRQNIRLTDNEVDMLLKNDSKTYIAVIDRMCSFPPQMGTFTADDFKDLKSSSLNKYLVTQKEEMENFYTTDYYSAVTALQDFLKSAVIEGMDRIITIPPGSGDTGPYGEVDHYVMISCDEVWDMWWTYWSEGVRTKHKGAAGTGPWHQGGAGL
jgi:hypothetical protein